MLTLTPADLADLYERKASAMTRRPGFARGVGQARVRLGDGLACDVEHEDRRLRVDLPPADGGGGSAPHPGQLMRASIGACLAMGYRLWAARLGVPIEHVELEVTCHYDARGQMGLDGEIPVGWQRLSIDVTVVSEAPERDVRRVIDQADRLSPMLANLSPAIARSHRLTVARPPAR